MDRKKIIVAIWDNSDNYRTPHRAATTAYRIVGPFLCVLRGALEILVLADICPRVFLHLAGDATKIHKVSEKVDG